MNRTILKRNLAALLKQRNSTLVFATGMLITNLLLAVIIFAQSERVVIVPPNISKDFWVTSSKVSPSYLEEMSIFLVNQMLDIAPSSAAYQRDIVLRHVAPEFHNALKKKLQNDAAYYRKEQLATHFRPLKLKVNDHKKQVIMQGDLISYIGGKQMSQSRDTYKLEYRYKNGRLLLANFELLKGQS